MHTKNNSDYVKVPQSSEGNESHSTDQLHSQPFSGEYVEQRDKMKQPLQQKDDLSHDLSDDSSDYSMYNKKI